MIIKDAFFSEDREYRYSLIRTWNERKWTACFIGLNPSTADENVDDPTIRKCMNYANRWGYGGIVMVNLFAYRTTDPRGLYKVYDPVGPANDSYIENASEKCEMTVCCWGTNGDFGERAWFVSKLLKNSWCLKYTKHGHPAHPLYLKADIELIPYNRVERK
jgi:hypothetical protein